MWGSWLTFRAQKIRLGRFADGPVMLVNGAEFTITAEDILGDVTQCGTTHKGLPGDCNPGDTVLVDDGKVKLEVIEVVARGCAPG